MRANQTKSASSQFVEANTKRGVNQTGNAPLLAMQAVTREISDRKKAVELELNALRKKYNDVEEELIKRRRSIRTGRYTPYIMACLLILFSLLFLLPRVLWGGFYAATTHGVVLAALIAVAALGTLCVLLMIIRRRFIRVGLTLLRWGLAAATLVVALALRRGAGDNDYLAVIILLGLSMLFCEIVWIRRYVKKQASSGSHRVFVFAIVIFLLAAALLPLLPIRDRSGESFLQGGVLERTVRYDMGADGYASLTRVMLTLDDTINVDKGELAVLGEVALGESARAVTTVAADAFTGVRSYSAVRLPESVVRIDANAFRESNVARLYVSSAALHLADGLANSHISEIYLEKAELVRLDGAVLREGITLRVPAQLLELYQVSYPTLAERILAI